jgi:hypothetical protein
MKSFPRIVNNDLTNDCTCPGGQKLLHKVNRDVLTAPISNTGNPDVLLDEAGIPILDQSTNGLIFDNLPHTLI